MSDTAFTASAIGQPACRCRLWLLLVSSFAFATAAQAADLTIYEDALASGWHDWSWSMRSATDTTCKATGASSLAVTYTAGWAGLSFRRAPAVNTAGYSAIRFAVFGRTGSGRLSLVIQSTDGGPGSQRVEFTPTPNVWSEINVPLSALGNPTQIARINIQDGTGAVMPTFNLDTLRLVGPPPPTLALSVDATAARKPISPLIYGVCGDTATAADAAFFRKLGITVRRWGGNNKTRYNWRIDASNTASNWYFENFRLGNGTALPADSATNRLIAQNRQLGMDTVLTVPMIGYVANNGSPTTCGFSVAKYGAQQQVNIWQPNCGNGVRADGSLVTGNNPTDASVAVGPEFVQDWTTYLVNRYGRADAGGVRFYNLDNEPDYWFVIHRDVAPLGLTYNQLRDLTYQYAAAIKTADPSAQTLGPAPMGWTYYWHSPYDGQRQDWSSPDDRNAHGGTPLVPWYLQQMQAYQQSHGTRILDYLDLHYYPQAPGVTLSAAGNAATQALRLNSTRSLWDPSYVDESWLASARPDGGGIIKLIPRMREWVQANYPGTKLAVGEYNWGAPEHINGALAQADVLGIFGREGLDMALLWSPPQSTQPAAYAFRMFRNYNGAGGRFGETSVSAVSNDQDRLALYAAEETATGALTLIAINKTAGSLSAPVTLNHFTPTGVVQIWRYSPALLTAVVHPGDQIVNRGRFTANCPPNSITLYRVPGRRL